MYQLARLFSAIGVLLGVYSLAAAMYVTWPMGAIVLFCLVAGTVIRLRRGRLTTLGSARWATENDLQNAGMIGGTSGAIIGRLPKAMAGQPMPSIRRLFDKKFSAKEACQAFWQTIRPACDRFVRLSNAVHTAVFSRSGGGKNVSYVGPLLLTCPESMAITDPKGENFLLSAKHRERVFGHRVVAVDPYQLVDKKPATLNPLDFIAADDPHCIDRCLDLANALIVRQPDEREPHWNDSAEIVLTAMIVTVVQYGTDAETRSLQTVRDLLSPEKLDAAMKVMCESDRCGGMLRRMGEQLLYFVEKERNSVLTTLNRHLRFLDSPAIAASTRTSSFSPADLRNGRMSVYFILPAEHMRSMPGLMRMWMSTTLRLVQAGGLQEQNKVHIVCDEAASLRRLEPIEDALSMGRACGIRLHLIYQSLAQLKECFPDGKHENVLANTTQVYFGINDNFTAQQVSDRLGESTIVVESGGTSSGDSHQQSMGCHPNTSTGNSYNSNSNWAQLTRRLMKPEELMTLSERTAITFVPGMAPIMTTLVRHYEEKLGRGQWISRAAAAVATLAMSLGFAMLMAILATIVSIELDVREQSTSGPVVPRAIPHVTFRR